MRQFPAVTCLGNDVPLCLVTGTWYIFLDLLLENPGLLRDNEEFYWLCWYGVILLYLFLMLAGGSHGSQGILHGVRWDGLEWD